MSNKRIEPSLDGLSEEPSNDFSATISESLGATYSSDLRERDSSGFLVKAGLLGAFVLLGLWVSLFFVTPEVEKSLKRKLIDSFASVFSETAKYSQQPSIDNIANANSEVKLEDSDAAESSESRTQSTQIDSQSLEPMSVKGELRFGDFLYYPATPNTLYLLKSLRTDQSGNFLDALEKRDIELVVLASSGGSVESSLTIANIIHDRKLATYIPKGESCLSACSFLYLAGEQRSIAVTGQLGVHQFFSNINKLAPTKDTYNKVQNTLSRILAALDKFNTPQFLIQRMLETPSNDMYYLLPTEISQVSTGRTSNLVVHADSFLAVRENSLDEIAKNRRAESCVWGDCWNGVGEFRLKNGLRFIGTHVNGVIDGYSIGIDSDGDVCESGMASGVLNGAYFCLYKSGAMFFGAGLNGRRHGAGFFVSPDGVVERMGEYRKGRLVEERAVDKQSIQANMNELLLFAPTDIRSKYVPERLREVRATDF
ncbi:MAG: hypothetical protein HWE20_16940 [Gammaproteobacteria bacterium]|nr:hypothetical protein [Gammaproteobacteria bacterium]